MTSSIGKSNKNEAPIKKNATTSKPLNAYNNEQTFFYNDLNKIDRLKNVPISDTTNAHESTINMTPILTTHPAIIASLTTAFTKQTILSTLSHIAHTPVTRTNQRYFSPPKHIELGESEVLKDTLNSYSRNELFENYNPEIGIKIALALGSMIVILIFYLIWENTCSSSRDLDLDMEFWLNYIDRKNIQKQRREDRIRFSFESLVSLELPDEIDNSNLATANWILEHSYLTNELPKIPNKYYLYELQSRHRKNYVNKELTLFKEKLEFMHSYEEFFLYDEYNNESVIINEKKMAWYKNPFKLKKRRFDRNDFKRDLEMTVQDYDSIRKRKRRKSCGIRKLSWPVSDHDYHQLYTLRKNLLSDQNRPENIAENTAADACCYKSEIVVTEI